LGCQAPTPAACREGPAAVAVVDPTRPNGAPQPSREAALPLLQDDPEVDAWRSAWVGLTGADDAGSGAPAVEQPVPAVDEPAQAGTISLHAPALDAYYLTLYADPLGAVGALDEPFAPPARSGGGGA